MSNRFKPAWWVIATGVIFGAFVAVLMKLGNPPNMGICAICFLRDTAGALKLHTIDKVSYIRPEIIGFILGSTIVALMTKELKITGGSSPILRFVIGAFVTIGALVFLGCPIRMLGRIAGGDWTALGGLLGLVIGIFVGVQFLKAGFNLGRMQPLPGVSGWVMPIIAIGLLILLLTKPGHIVLGPTKHAPLVISLIAGLIVSGLAQRSRFCTIGGIRDLILIGDSHLFQGLVALLVMAFIFNLILGQFHPGASPIAHPYFIWNFGGMFLAGLGLVLLGGCPFRQMVMSGYGNTDAGISVLGMLFGAGIAHNFNLVASPQGIPNNGKVAVLLGIIILLVIGFLSRAKE
ncbi:MAG: YedE family putative selenium transporter [candidate division WOR-3 bacterium]